MFKKKLSTVLCCLGLSISLVGCNLGGTNTSSPTSEPKLDTNLPEKEVVTGSAIDTTKEPEQDYTLLSPDIMDKVKDYCKSKTYVKMTQEMSSYSLLKNKKGDEKKVADVEVEADLKNKITLSNLVVGGDESDTVYYFADDNKKKIHLSKILDGKYIQDTNSKSSINIDYKKVNNTYSFINEISGGLLPQEGTLGVTEDNKYTFTTIRDARDEDISGIEYDRLGQTTVKLTIKEDKNNNLIPESLSMDTTFFVGSNKYGVSTICKFSSFSKQKLKLPKYVKIAKEKTKKKSNKKKKK